MREVVSWDEYFMAIAETVSTRCKDPITQVGVVIVNEEKRIISTGYNGMPPGYPETPETWGHPQKHEVVLHAEANAICHATAPLKGATLYTTYSPCKECVKLIIAAGIKTVIFKNSKYWTPEVDAFFKICKINFRNLYSL
jgi:dCMP deaminase